MESGKASNNKRGNASVVLIIVLLIVIGIVSMFVKLNWRKLKAEASFGITVALVVLAILLILFLLIKRSINKARKERAQKKLEKERAKHEEEISKLEEANARLTEEVDALEDKLEEKDSK